MLVVLIAAGVVWFKGYYDQRYKLEDYYYTVVPIDYEIAPVQARDSDGKEVGILKATYKLTGYNKDGEARELEFDASLDMHDFYPLGTYIRVSMSKLWATGKSALDEADVPAGAVEQIRKTFTPSSAKTLDEYAAERTRQLSSRNAPSLTVTCEVKDITLVYTYLYAAGAKEPAPNQTASGTAQNLSSQQWTTSAFATLSEERPADAYGTNDTLQVGKTANGKEVFAFIRIDLGSDWLADELSDARLFLKPVGQAIPARLRIEMLSGTPVRAVIKCKKTANKKGIFGQMKRRYDKLFL